MLFTYATKSYFLEMGNTEFELSGLACTNRSIWKGSVRQALTGHGDNWDVEGNAGYIHEPYIHYSFSNGITSWIHRHRDIRWKVMPSYILDILHMNC